MISILLLFESEIMEKMLDKFFHYLEVHSTLKCTYSVKILIRSPMRFL